MRRNLINLFFPKDVYRRSLFFFLALPARSHELADVFEKNEKKNKPRSVYRLTHLMLFRMIPLNETISITYFVNWLLPSLFANAKVTHLY